VKLPGDRSDPIWQRIRAHDLEELWDQSRAPHVAAAYRARQQVLCTLVEELAGPSGRLLDVGSAQGTLGLTLAERGVRVDLLDVQPECVEYARARYERGAVGFHVGHLSETCPPFNEYDVVTCSEVIEHVPSPSNFLLTLKSKVRPGGYLCLTTPNADYLLAHLPSFGRAAQAVVDGTQPNSLDGDAHAFLYTREELIALVRGVGLKLVRHGFFLPFWLEGHLKTRIVHRWLYNRRGAIAEVNPTLGSPWGRRLCSGQYVVARVEPSTAPAPHPGSIS
jgi:2-polyprenyl-3-methyl-5-hydroxy-6-metoxy-1,4-benzoquinol methylase